MAKSSIMNYFIMLAIFLIISSCSKKDNEIKETDINGTKIIVDLKGIAGGQTQELIKASQRKSSRASMNLVSEQVISGEEMDFLVEVGLKSKKSVSDNKTDNTINTKAVAAQTSLLTTSPVDLGVKYRLLIYDFNTNMLVKDLIGASGVKQEIAIDAGKKYKWYAFSVNSAELPDLVGNVISSQDLVNKDFLFDSGTLDAINGDNFIGVIFARKTTRIIHAVDVRGLFGTLNNNSTIALGTNVGGTFSSIFETGDFNIVTGEFSNFKKIESFTGNSWNILSPSDGKQGAVKYVVAYSSRPINVSENGLITKFTNLSILMDDPLVNNIYKNRTWTNMSVPIKNTALTLSLGDEVYINTRPVESGIQLGQRTTNMAGYQPGPTYWARTNLYYDATAADKYKFRADNESYTGFNQALAFTDFWNWGAETPGGANVNVDPCRRVYPLETWRMPTEEEFMSLGNFDAASSYGMYSGGSMYATVRELESGTESLSYPQRSRKLWLFFNGYRDSNGTLQEAYPVDRSNLNPAPAKPIKGGSHWFYSGQSPTGAWSNFYDGGLHEWFDGSSIKTSNSYGKKQMGAIPNVAFEIRCVRNILHN